MNNKNTEVTKTFYYRNNSLVRTFNCKHKAEQLARREHIKYNIRLETYTFAELVTQMGQGNAERYWLY